MIKKLVLMAMGVFVCTLALGCGSSGPAEGSDEEEAIRKQVAEKAKAGRAKAEAERAKGQ